MLNYILDELKKIMAIDSPSGFTRKAADYIMQQLREFGFEPELTRKGCVLCCLGGEGSPVVFSALTPSAEWYPKSRATEGLS